MTLHTIFSAVLVTWTKGLKGVYTDRGARLLRGCPPQVGANCQNQTQNACKQFIESIIILQEIAQDWRARTLQLLALFLKLNRARVIVEGK